MSIFAKNKTASTVALLLALAGPALAIDLAGDKVAVDAAKTAVSWANRPMAIWALSKARQMARPRRR
jgi:hypothetical protein